MRCLVFCDRAHDLYMQLLAYYPAADLEIVRVYACGEDYKSSEYTDLFPLSSVTEKQEFDVALLFLFESEQVKKLLGIVYEDKMDYTILNQHTFSKECLSGAGQLELLRLEIKADCPSEYNLIMGDFSYSSNKITVNDELYDGSVKASIGKFCSIGADLTLLLAVEHQSMWNTTYPFYRVLDLTDSEHSSVRSKGDIRIGNDVWIGEGATILSGVEIGDGCIIGSRTVVAKNVTPYSIIVGNPGHIVKKRFSQDRIDKLLEMRWWDWDPQKIYDALTMLQSENIEALYAFWKSWV